MTFLSVIVITPENQINIFGGYSVYSLTACSLLPLRVRMVMAMYKSALYNHQRSCPFIFIKSWLSHNTLHFKVHNDKAVQNEGGFHN